MSSALKNKIEILGDGPVLPGCISVARAKCGKTYCRCHKDPANLHGPYYRWTGVLGGKHTTVTLTKEEADECEKRIKNYRALQRKFDLLLEKSLEKAPWNCRE